MSISGELKWFIGGGSFFTGLYKGLMGDLSFGYEGTFMEELNTLNVAGVGCGIGIVSRHLEDSFDREDTFLGRTISGAFIGGGMAAGAYWMGQGIGHATRSMGERF